MTTRLETDEATTATEACPELEELAAFVDGRLEGERRRRMVVHLDRCPDCYETFTETVRFRREDEAATGGGEVLTSPRFGGLDRRKVGWIAAAAAALFVLAVVVPLLRTDPARTLFTGPEPTEVLLATDELVPAEGWAPVPLGPDALGFSGGLTPERIAFRLGVRLVDLRAAARSGQPEAAGAALTQVEALTALAAGTDPPATLDAALREARGAVEEGNADLLAAATTELETGFEELLSPFELAFGKWAEAGRLAAAAGQEGFFLSPAFTHFRERLRDRRPLDPPLERQLEAVDAATAERSPPPERLAELRTAFGTLVRLR